MVVRVRLTQKRRCPSLAGALAAIVVACAPAITAARADVTVEGGADRMVIVAENVTRQDVVTQIARRLAFKVSGPVVEGAPVNGRFRGNLGDVLMAVLTANNFLIVYEGGRPASLILSEKGQAGAGAFDGSMPSLLPNAGLPAQGGGYDLRGTGMEGGEGQIYIDPALKEIMRPAQHPPPDPRSPEPER
jgi:hypothetical protein